MEFQRNKQVMVSIVKRVISQCRDGKEHEEIPFISSLLQNYDDEDKVNFLFLCLSLSLPLRVNYSGFVHVLLFN